MQSGPQSPPALKTGAISKLSIEFRDKPVLFSEEVSKAFGSIRKGCPIACFATNCVQMNKQNEQRNVSVLDKNSSETEPPKLTKTESFAAMTFGIATYSECRQ